ncbi:MAG: hypothetical protein LBF40_01570 [Deltaproteobacteria bacterium]|jgi:flavodoxin|nr:hypothetical protein [Deltaproteobacteria bacterium]
MIIACYSWGGTVRAIAGSVRGLAGGDIFGIEPAVPCALDYESCLKEAKRDLDALARPKLAGRVPDMEKHGETILGCPNWYSTIPMPVATFLEDCDFSGKTMLPF